jgi:predicted phosphate transport protein (TIGR00153 family)
MAIESRNIFGWLGMKQEESILKDAQDHVDITYETVVNFKNAVSAYTEGNFKAREDFVVKVRECERKADVIRNKMVDILSESPLLPPDREDLMHFAKTLDRIADWTCGTARLLNFLEERLSPEIMKNITIATDIIFDSAASLKDAIHSLTTSNLKQAIQDCLQVDKLESKADDQKQTLVGQVLHSKLEANKLLIVYNLAQALEGITDKIEDAAEHIKVIAIKAR